MRSPDGQGEAGLCRLCRAARRSFAGQTYARLKYGRIDRIFRSGLHEFLTSFIESNNALGLQIQEDFLMIPAAVAGGA
jgi:uncharacterized alpha-E superfamily protein